MSATNDGPVTPETLRALQEVMSNPRRCCNADTPLFIANSILQREPKLTYANLSGLAEWEAQMVLVTLQELFPDQREAIRARAAQMMPGSR